MDVKEAINLVNSGEEMSFSQIKEAHAALAGTTHQELTKLNLLAHKKLHNVKDSLFGMSLEELIAAAEVADTVTVEKDKASDEYKSMISNIEAQIASVKEQNKGRLTEAQRVFLENYTSRLYKDDVTWEDLSDEDKRLLVEEGKEDPTLAPTAEQLAARKNENGNKPANNQDKGRLTEAQRAFLENYTSRLYKDDVTWEDLSDEDKRLLVEEGKEDPTLAMTAEQLAAGKKENKNKPAEQDENKPAKQDDKKPTGNENDEEDIVKPVIPGQENYELDVPTENANAALINRNYSQMALWADSINPLDEKEEEFASSRDALDMLDVKDEANNSVDVREEIVETARVQTMAELLTSKDKITKEQFNKQFRDNIDMMVFSIINADRVAELTKSGDTKTMRKEFGEIVNNFIAGGKKSKIEVKVDNVIGALSVANQRIANVTDKIEKQFGKIPAVAAINNRLNKIDSKLTKKLGKKYVTAKAIVRGVSGIVTDLGLATLAGATGPVGMGIYAYYTFNKHAMPFFNAYKKETENTNISLSEYAKAHKGDATMAGLYTVSSIFTAGIGAAVAAHNVATSAGATMADSFTKFATTGKIVAGATAVGTKQVLDISDAYKNGTAGDVAKAAAKAAGAIALFAIAAEARNHFDLVPHGAGHDGAAGDTTPNVVNNVVNNYYTTENNYYDYSSHDQVYVDNCCEPCDCDQNAPVHQQTEPVKPEPTPVKPEPTPVKPEPTPVKPEPTPVKPEPTPVTPRPTLEPDPLPKAPESDYVSVAVDPAPEFEVRENAPEFVERGQAPEFVVQEDAPDLNKETPVVTETKTVVGQEQEVVQKTEEKVVTPPVEQKQAPGTRVLANGVHDYNTVSSMGEGHAAEGFVDEDRVIYDANKSTDEELKKDLEQQREEWKNTRENIDKKIPVTPTSLKIDLSDVQGLQKILIDRGNTK